MRNLTLFVQILCLLLVMLAVAAAVNVVQEPSTYTGIVAVLCVVGMGLGFVLLVCCKGVVRDFVAQAKADTPTAIAGPMPGPLSAPDAGKRTHAFMTRMSHEIRTPMNAIIGLSHLCQQTRLDAQQRQYISKILHAAHGLLNVLNELMDFSSAKEGKLHLEPLPFHLYEVMDTLARIVSPKAKEKGLEFVFHVEQSLPSVFVGDQLRLTQVLINLTNNAIKYTDSGTVAVQVQAVRRLGSSIMLLFKVQDTGVGVDVDAIQPLLQPLVQADGSLSPQSSKEGHGAGIGLPISQHIISLMGGQIVAAALPQGGSEFSFTVQLAIGEEQERIAPRSFQDIRALVVDDAPLAQEIICANMTSLGITTDSASSGVEALNKIQDAQDRLLPYHVIILDWRMPGMDGVETAARLKETAPDATMPVVLMHSDYDIDALNQVYPLREHGITAFLPKPATPKAFLDAIQQALSSQETGQTAPSMKGPVLTSNSRVLLVEDNEINQEIACELLKMAHVDVDVANNGQEAVDAVEKTLYALIFMDVQMPVMDGLEATRVLRRKGYTMPIIAMTAHATSEDKDLSLAAGMNDHLTKPLDPEALFTTMNQWVPFAGKGRTQASDNTHGTASVSAGMAGTATGMNTASDTASRAVTLPHEIKGFNLAAGLAAVGNNSALYVNLLQKFSTRYATITEDIAASLMNKDLETAVRHAHTVKGIAANLGAEDLADAAGRLERTITHDPSMITPHLNALIMELTQSIDAVRQALGISASYAPQPKPEVVRQLTLEEMARVQEQLPHLKDLERDWASGHEAAQGVQRMLTGTRYQENAQLLLQAVEDFETQGVVALAQALQSELVGSTGEAA